MTLKSFRQQWKKELQADGEEFKKDSSTNTSFEGGNADRDSSDNFQEKDVEEDIETQVITSSSMKIRGQMQIAGCSI